MADESILRGSSFDYGQRKEIKDMAAAGGVSLSPGAPQRPRQPLRGGRPAEAGRLNPDPMAFLRGRPGAGDLSTGLNAGPGAPGYVDPGELARMSEYEKWMTVMENARTPEMRAMAALALRRWSARSAATRQARGG